jgi:hypothetical protein
MKEWQRILLWGIGMTILILILKVVSADAHENAVESMDRNDAIWVFIKCLETKINKHGST